VFQLSDPDGGPSLGLAILRRGLFLVSLPLFFINFALPIQAKELGASALEIGALFSLFTVSLLLVRPVVGFGLDRFGRRVFIVTAVCFYVVANGLYAYAGSVAEMYVARFLQGIGAAFLLISVDTITADLTDEHDRTASLGRNIEIQSRASIVGTTLGFTLLGAMPLVAWRYSFAAFALCAFVALVILVIQMPETRSGRAAENVRFEFRLSGQLRRLMSVVVASAFVSALIQPIYLIYLQDKFSLPAIALGWAFLPAGIVYAVLPSRLGALSRRWGNINLFAIGLAAAGVLYVILPMVDQLVGFAVLYTVTAVGWAMADPARKALVIALSDGESIGRSLGVSELYAGIGATIGPLAGGYLYDQHGASVTFVFNGLLLIVAAIAAKLMLQGVTPGSATGQN
jgi:MFS transporter, DHA1 family, multidrug resistance protein